MSERIIGIDFGTSTSVVRVRSYDDNGKPLGDVKAVKESNGSEIMPTLIRKTDNGGVYYGVEAESGKRDSELYQNFKLKLKSENSAEKEQAQKLTEEFIKYMHDQYSYQSNQGHFGESGERERTIVSYPVKWDDETRKFMVEAAKKAGFSNVEGVDEAQSAIWAALVRCENYLTEKKYFKQNESTNILLIDMGAGTTDIVICRYTYGENPKNEILCIWPKDENILFGGSEVDKILKEYIFSKIPSGISEKLTEKIKATEGVKEFKAWKENTVSKELRDNGNVTVYSRIDNVLDMFDSRLEEFCLNRSEFERIAADYLNEFPKLVNGAISHSGLKNGEIDLVIVTGGHSQWYFVNEMLKGSMGSINLPKIKADSDRIISLALPQETVATGLVFAPLANSTKNSTVNINKAHGDIRTTVYSDGTYSGKVVDGIRHGNKAKFTKANGDVVEFYSDHFKIIYKYTYANGDVYEGDYKFGKRTGKGKFTWTSGSVYEGDWVDGKRTGKGKYTCVNGDVYEGDWVDGVQTGKGKCTYAASGNVYEGDWANGKRTGKCKYTYANGDVYEGDYKNGMQNGEGKFTWTDGDVYEGDWIDGKRTGKGKFTWTSGSVYEGDWVDGKRTGKGKYTCVNGDVYEGDWVDGVQTGKGKCTYAASGNVYEGDWVNGKQNGEGKYTYADGSGFKGFWVKGVLRGVDKYI